jgi:predicted N-acetyltransferase YhbS
MHVRTALPADIPALHALIEIAFRGESSKRGWTHEADLLGGQRTDVEAISEILTDPRQAMFMAETDQTLVGCVVVADEGKGVAYLGMLSVSPELQAGGIGRKLVAAAEAHAREVLGARVMEMTVVSRRTELIAWYLRQGYVDTGREKPFPLDDPRFGLPKTRDLKFAVLAKPLH